MAFATAGCAAWLHEEAAEGPDAVDPELRLPLRLSVVGLRATMLLLYGGAAHEVFLGCLSCERGDHDGIFNPEGPYGSTTNTRSIWNRHGPYGDRSSPLSPWNPHGTMPPLIKDEYDRPHGYFTANPNFADRTTDPATIRFLKVWSERMGS